MLFCVCDSGSCLSRECKEEAVCACLWTLGHCGHDVAISDTAVVIDWIASKLLQLPLGGFCPLPTGTRNCTEV